MDTYKTTQLWLILYQNIAKNNGKSKLKNAQFKD